MKCYNILIENVIDSGRAGGREKRMDTFLIMARALAKAASLDILRLDIQFNKIDDEFSALCVLGDTSNDYVEINYIISEDGTIRKREEGVC